MEPGIEGIPFIIRFKTETLLKLVEICDGIEGIPFIIRFKTHLVENGLNLMV